MEKSIGNRYRIEISMEEIKNISEMADLQKLIAEKQKIILRQAYLKLKILWKHCRICRI